MASKRHIRDKQCTGKIRHTLEGAYQSRRELMSRGNNANLNIYKCKFCKSYHVGHRLFRG